VTIVARVDGEASRARAFVEIAGRRSDEGNRLSHDDLRESRVRGSDERRVGGCGTQVAEIITSFVMVGRLLAERCRGQTWTVLAWRLRHIGQMPNAAARSPQREAATPSAMGGACLVGPTPARRQLARDGGGDGDGREVVAEGDLDGVEDESPFDRHQR
jgi:hypothetical protein